MVISKIVMNFQNFDKFEKKYELLDLSSAHTLCRVVSVKGLGVAELYPPHLNRLIWI